MPRRVLRRYGKLPDYFSDANEFTASTLFQGEARAFMLRVREPGLFCFEPIFRVQPEARPSKHFDGCVPFCAKAPMPAP